MSTANTPYSRAIDTLSGIAGKYHTSVEKLQAYNGIEATVITVDQTIKIPPQDYVIPEHVPSETEPPVNEPVAESVTEGLLPTFLS